MTMTLSNSEITSALLSIISHVENLALNEAEQEMLLKSAAAIIENKRNAMTTMQVNGILMGKISK